MIYTYTCLDCKNEYDFRGMSDDEIPICPYCFSENSEVYQQYHSWEAYKELCSNMIVQPHNRFETVL